MIYINSKLILEKFDKWGKTNFILCSFTINGNGHWQVCISVASWHFEGMFLAKHSLQRKLGQPSGTFIIYTCHQQDPVLKVSWVHKQWSFCPELQRTLQTNGFTNMWIWQKLPWNWSQHPYSCSGNWIP